MQDTVIHAVRDRRGLYRRPAGERIGAWRLDTDTAGDDVRRALRGVNIALWAGDVLLNRAVTAKIARWLAEKGGPAAKHPVRAETTVRVRAWLAERSRP